MGTNQQRWPRRTGWVGTWGNFKDLTNREIGGSNPVSRRAKNGKWLDHRQICFSQKKKTQQRLQSKEALKLATNIIFISDNIKDKLKINPHKNSNFSGVKHVYQLSQHKIQLKFQRKSAQSEDKLEKNISKNQIKSLKHKNEKSKMIFNQFYIIKSVILE